MTFFFFLAAFLLFNWLNRAIKGTPLQERWRTIFNFGQIGAILIYAFLENILRGIPLLIIGDALLFGSIWYLNKQDEFKGFRGYFESHYPLIATGVIIILVKLILPDFYEEYGEYFALPVVAAFVWIMSRWAASKKQREELRIVKAQNLELDRLVAERTAELTLQKQELEKAIELLQTTQQQLIQAEKLASLGELTAGIAHEIQNPLNFVNNFADVSTELIDEMEEELNKGDTEEAIAIAGDLKQNLEKIIHHGKRADSIVKGMLQHSRASTGQKEKVNINNLADEYLRLAYHGLRAKDKSFNAEMITHFADGMPFINVVPQDVGRVLLNLFTNAFYAVRQKQKTAGADFKPLLEVTTTFTAEDVIIKVKDNGTGIPDEIRDKIMQPFFTTKPTGEGTGLGLSLSYDIIVKGHGGNIDIESAEGEGSTFTIELPIA
ncbi:sensor histidine kinase [Mucilaginibacter auburnensis]|uniref:histidine kinase n=1 Tax=Mucilaginibacter auburnensis TaxID=1457233 RepID=A0A2H9VQ90_9SPHI|nr:ATP-binding protein [Mucilaginibacter auburnensis]PJJ80493.1 phospho-acceptor domain-containing protein [Mucilaginibacter auburnensis]